MSTETRRTEFVTRDEYVDLKHLHNGVRRMTAETRVKIGDVLPTICARLTGRHVAR